MKKNIGIILKAIGIIIFAFIVGPILVWLVGLLTLMVHHPVGPSWIWALPDWVRILAFLLTTLIAGGIQVISILFVKKHILTGLTKKQRLAIYILWVFFFLLFIVLCFFLYMTFLTSGMV